MTMLLRWLDRRTYLMLLLFVFWAIFWGLNGLDKFYNGASAPNLERWATKAVLVDAKTGEPAYRLQPTEPRGFFGVTRDNKMIGYFARIGMGKGVALFSLYAIAVIEIVLGLAFLALIIWSALPYRTRDRDDGLIGLFRDRTVHRLAFKGGILVFVLFATGDILFGDRVELWEHGTYMVLCLVTYDMWYRTDAFIQARERTETDRDALSHTLFTEHAGSRTDT